MNRIRQSYFRQTWLAIILAGCFGGLLAGAHLALTPLVEANKRNETRDLIPSLVSNKGLPAAKKLTISKETVPGRIKSHTVYQATSQGEVQGYVVAASGQGYAGPIELLVGLTPGFERISGLYILDQKETPGLGSKIVEDDFRRQFIGKTTDQKIITTTSPSRLANTIDAITGATISSRSVSTIMNTMIADIREPLSKRIRMRQKQSTKTE